MKQMHEPRRPKREPYELDEDFQERMADYYRKLEEYEEAQDRAADEAKERRYEQDSD